MRKLIPRAHITACDGSPASNIAYCHKEDPNPYIYGDISSAAGQQGKRTDLDAFLADLKAGNLDEDYLRDTYKSIEANTPNYFWNQISRHTPQEPVKEHPLYEWQAKLKKILDGPSDDRTIIFLVDFKGNSGKTWFAHYYCRLRNEAARKSAMVMYPGKLSDMSQAYATTTEVLFMDCARKRAENLQYGFLEEIKNGLVFKAKYNSEMRNTKVPHIVVNMNELPDMDALSHDRIIVFYVSAPDDAPGLVDTRALYAEIDDTDKALVDFNELKAVRDEKKKKWNDNNDYDG